MTKSFYNFITIVSLLSLFHCAYSAAQHRAYLRLIEQPFVRLPTDVLAQTIISLVVLIYGASFVASPFQQIKSDPNRDRSWDEAGSCLSFATFGNRAYALSPSYAARRQQVISPLKHILLAKGQQRLLTSSSSISPSRLSSSSSAPPQPDFSQLPGARLPRKAGPSRPAPTLEITPKQASDAFQHCLNLVKSHDIDNYLSILTMPKKAHPELFALHALNVELAVIRDKIESRGNKDTTGMYRLQFWKDALSSIYAVSHLPVPRQPVAIALCSFAPDASPALLEPLVTARQQTLGDRPFNTVFEVCGYGAKTTGSLIQLRAQAIARATGIDLSPHSEELSRAATDVGGAFGVMNLIRSTLPLFTRGVVLLPLDILTMNGLTPDKVYNKKQPEDVRHVIRDMVKVAESQLSSGRQRISTLPRPIRQAFYAPVCVVDHIIATAKKLDYDVYSPYLQRRDPLLLWSLLLRKLTGRC